MDNNRKILMLGNKDSGKTTYMASAYGALKAGNSGFTVYGDSDSDAWLMNLYRKIKNGQYPIPTSKREQFSFTLYHYQDKILSFEWIDYFGGVITEKKVAELAEDIEDADAIMIFLDASSLVKNGLYDTQLHKILYLLADKLSNTEHVMNILAVITKYDLIGDSQSFETVCKPLESLALSLSQRKNIHFRTVPVSCTANGFVNVELPLIDILYTGLCVRKTDHVKRSIEQENQAKVYRKYSGPVDWVISKLFGMKTNAELAKEHHQVHLQEQELWLKLETPLKQMEKYRNNYVLKIPRVSEKTASNSPRSRFSKL